MPVASWDLTLAVLFSAGIAFGYILQRDKIIATLLSVYVALIITQAISGNVQEFFHGERTINQFWLHFNASSFSIRSTVFIGTIILLSTRGGISGGKSKGILSPIEIIIYSALTTALVVSSIFYFMPQETRDAFTTASQFARIIISNYNLWLILPVGTMIAASFFRKDSD